MALYPLLFDPIYQYRIWGGRRFETLLAKALPDGPVGEAWVLSDRDYHPSRVSNGPLTGKTITQLIEESPAAMLGEAAHRYKRFPLLLKFLDAKEKLSVQVHPSDAQTQFLPPGEHGKTEAWVVLDSEPGSVIYDGLTPGTTEASMKDAVANGTVASCLASFEAQVGDGVFVPAGTVHTLGAGVMVFEVQENSDVTFRLYDWDRNDPHTGKPRELQIDEAMACIDFTQGAGAPVTPVVESESMVVRERLFDCEYFKVWRLTGRSQFMVGAAGQPRILVGIGGDGQVQFNSTGYPLHGGEVMLLPAEVGSCFFEARGSVTLLEIALPEKPKL